MRIYMHLALFFSNTCNVSFAYNQYTQIITWYIISTTRPDF